MKTPINSPKNSLKKQKKEKNQPENTDSNNPGYIQLKQQVGCIQKQIDLLTRHKIETCSSVTTNSRNSGFLNSNSTIGNNSQTNIEQDIEQLKVHNTRLCSAVKDLERKLGDEQQRHRMTVICLRNSERGREAAVKRNQELQGEMHQFFNTFGGMFSKNENDFQRDGKTNNNSQIYDIPKKLSEKAS